MITTLDPIVIGVLTAAVTEILKLAPILAKSELTRALTAIVVMIIGTYAFTDGITLANFGQVLIYGFASYKMIVQPATKTLGISTQK